MADISPWPFTDYEQFMANFRVDFEPNSFLALIDQKGYRAQWSRWSPCPCVRDASAAPRINCPLCHGRGDRFTNSMEIRALMTSLGAQTEFREYSQWFIGTAMLTVYSPDRCVTYRDRFVLLDSVSARSEYRQRGTDPSVTIEHLQYAATEIVLLYKIGVGGDSYTDLVAGADYVLNADGSLTWANTANAPAPGEWYSVVYNYHPTYQVLDLMNDVRDTVVRDPQSGVESIIRLPQRAMVRRSHLMYQSGVSA